MTAFIKAEEWSGDASSSLNGVLIAMQTSQPLQKLKIMEMQVEKNSV